jgi:hypothetical protein
VLKQCKILGRSYLGRGSPGLAKIYGSMSDPQSNELTRGSPELDQHFRLKGGSHRRKSAGCPKFDMVGSIARLSRWGGGGSIPRSNDFLLPSLRVEEGGGGSAPYGRIRFKLIGP